MTSETIRERKSVRTYQEKAIDGESMSQIRNFLTEVGNPFGVPIRFNILDAKRDKVSSPVILGANTYVAGSYKRQENAELAFGYSFEKFVLYASKLGLGTVWLAATIDRKAFERAVKLQSDEVMPTVSPLGYAAEKRSVRESLMRRGMKSDARNSFESLFYQGDFEHPLRREEAGKWEKPLEMVRLAPSATNKQPWRAVVDADAVHFYEMKTRGYANETTGDVQKVDLGIALCHFEIAANEEGITGRFVRKDPQLVTAENTEYIASYRPEV